MKYWLTLLAVISLMCYDNYNDFYSVNGFKCHQLGGNRYNIDGTCIKFQNSSIEIKLK